MLRLQSLLIGLLALLAACQAAPRPPVIKLSALTPGQSARWATVIGLCVSLLIPHWSRNRLTASTGEDKPPSRLPAVSQRFQRIASLRLDGQLISGRS